MLGNSLTELAWQESVSLEMKMRDNSNDRTLERNYIQKYRFLIREYELVKAKRHHRFRFLQDFYAYHGTNRQTFAKYYNRYRQSGDAQALLPRKRGPKWKRRLA